MIEPEVALPPLADPARQGDAGEPRDAAPSSPPQGVADGVDARARLRAMFAQHYAFVWRVLRRLGVPFGAIDDAAQQVFFVATRRIAEIAVDSERAFLVSTAMRIASEARRAYARNRELANDGLDEMQSDQPDPEQVTDRKRALELLDRVLDAMPFELRVVFVLFEVEGLSTHDIAPMLGLPRGTVASRLRRARAEFHAIAKRLRAKAAFRGGGHE
jgi:RNA polymerase sigma-70 factor (ECF subfamily)